VTRRGDSITNTSPPYANIGEEKGKKKEGKKRKGGVAGTPNGEPYSSFSLFFTLGLYNEHYTPVHKEKKGRGRGKKKRGSGKGRGGDVETEGKFLIHRRILTSDIRREGRKKREGGKL